MIVHVHATVREALAACLNFEPGVEVAGAVLNRWSRLSVPVAGLGCLGLAVITFLGLLSIGAFLLPADLAAAVALLWISERRAAL